MLNAVSSKCKAYYLMTVIHRSDSFFYNILRAQCKNSYNQGQSGLDQLGEGNAGNWPTSPASDQGLMGARPVGGGGSIESRASCGEGAVGGQLASSTPDQASWLATVGVIVFGHSGCSSILVPGFLYVDYLF